MKYTFNNLKDALPNIQAWSGPFFAFFFSIPTVWFLANYTKIKPNHVTLIRLILLPITFAIFFIPNIYFLIAGAILFELNYILDNIDGQLARLTKQISRTGHFLDGIADKLKNLIIIPLTISFYFLTSYSWALILLGIFILLKISEYITSGLKYNIILAPPIEKTNNTTKIKKKILKYPIHTELEFLCYFLLIILSIININFLTASILITFISHIINYIYKISVNFTYLNKA